MLHFKLTKHWRNATQLAGLSYPDSTKKWSNKIHTSGNLVSQLWERGLQGSGRLAPWHSTHCWSLCKCSNTVWPALGTSRSPFKWNRRESRKDPQKQRFQQMVRSEDKVTRSFGARIHQQQNLMLYFMFFGIWAYSGNNSQWNNDSSWKERIKIFTTLLASAEISTSPGAERIKIQVAD